MPRRSSFYASPRGLAVCMTLTWVSKKGGYWLNCVCISAFCGSERIGTSDGSLERRKKSGRLQNGLNPHWNSRANVHTYTHSVSRQSGVHSEIQPGVSIPWDILYIFYTEHLETLFDHLHQIWCDVINTSVIFCSEDDYTWRLPSLRLYLLCQEWLKKEFDIWRHNYICVLWRLNERIVSHQLVSVLSSKPPSVFPKMSNDDATNYRYQDNHYSFVIVKEKESSDRRRYHASANKVEKWMFR